MRAFRNRFEKIAQYEEARKIGDPVALERELALDPDRHEARVKLAKVLNAQGRRDEAADHLLYVMRKDRTFDDDGARRQLLEFSRPGASGPGNRCRPQEAFGDTVFVMRAYPGRGG